MNKKILSVLLIISIITLGLSFNIGTTPPNDSIENSNGLLGFSLIKPPLYVYASDYGDPLNTANIGMFCYYNYTSGFTLVDTVAGWLGYTDFGNYYDGEIRVYMHENQTNFGSGEFVAGVGNDYIDIYARVRVDGYIMTWLNRSNTGLKYLSYWGDFPQNAVPVPQYPNATCLWRAMQRIFYAMDGDLDNAPETSEVYYYDFEYPTSTRFCWFGDHAYPNEYCYYTIPSGVTVDYAHGCARYTGDGSSADGYINIDFVELWSRENSNGVWIEEFSISSAYYTLDTQHEVQTRWTSGSSMLDSIIMFWTH